MLPIRQKVRGRVAFADKGKLTGQTKSKDGERGGMITLIAVLKLAKGLVLLAVGVGALSLLHKDLRETAERFADYLHIDPGSHYFQAVISKVGRFDSSRLPLISIGTFVYAALFLTEGVGLMLRKRWAEYFTVIVTSSFVPLEIYELIKHFTVIKVIALTLNVAVVIYLVWRLRTKKGDEKKR